MRRFVKLLVPVLRRADLPGRFVETKRQRRVFFSSNRYVSHTVLTTFPLLILLLGSVVTFGRSTQSSSFSTSSLRGNSLRTLSP